MKIKINKKRMGMIAAVMALLLAQVPGVALAWGPQDRPRYTNEQPATRAVFNSITNNAAVGNEMDFVRVAEKDPNATFRNEVELEAGKQYEVYIYYHNDASETYNYSQYQNVGVARNARVASSFPTELKKGERGEIMGKITATNTDPLAVWDEAYVIAKQAMTLHYVIGSAKIYNQGTVNGSVLSTNLFSDTGTFIGYNALNGVVPGCDQYSGQVVYTIQTRAVATEEPEEPEPEEPKPEEPEPEEPTPEEPDEPVVMPEDPEIPKELPKTGPMEIALGAVLLVVLVAGVGYWWKTHRDVKHATKRAKGRK